MSEKEICRVHRCIWKDSRKIGRAMIKKVANNRKSKIYNRKWNTKLFQFVSAWFWCSTYFIIPCALVSTKYVLCLF